MTLAVRVLPDAEAELAAAAAWYEQHRAGLGLELIAAVDEAIDQIRSMPDAAPLWKHGHAARKHRLRRFPFYVVYRTSATALEVLAFAHEKRRPGYWVDRR